MQQVSAFPELKVCDKKIILSTEQGKLPVRDLKPLDRDLLNRAIGICSIERIFPLGKSDLLIRMVAPSGRSG